MGLARNWRSPDFQPSGQPGEDSLNSGVGLVAGATIDAIAMAILLRGGVHQRVIFEGDGATQMVFPAFSLHLQWRIALGSTFTLHPGIGMSTFTYRRDDRGRANGTVNIGMSVMHNGL